MSETTTDSVYVDPERRTYEEMTARAKAMHPDAVARLNGHTWEIVLETEIEEERHPETVDPSWAGTPAEEAYRTPDSSGSNALEEWAEHSDYWREPLSVVAAHYNLAVEQQRLSRQLRDQKMEEAGLGDWNRMFWDAIRDPAASVSVSELDDRERELMGRAMREADEEAREILAPKRQELWNRA